MHPPEWLDPAANVERTRVGDRLLLTRSPEMERVLELSAQARESRRPVLITGETGTGKELVARLLHDQGQEGTEPFLAINCAAFPAHLMEDEIFGHKRGAFTDARSDRAGKIAAAGRGSLFFDEMGELPLEFQAKLLRLLQENTYTMLGSDQELRAECRFLFATNRDIAELVARNLFRLDLYYRISVFEIALPPLRQRRSEIAPLVRYFLLRFAAELGAEPPGIEESALAALVAYDWPGNIRELENVMYRLLAGRSREMIRLTDLPMSVQQALFTQPGPGIAASNGLPTGTFDELMQAHARSLIQQALAEAGGNKAAAARRLGMKRTRLIYQMKELGLS
ncbi:MAG: sigma-54-dependent Fis family transcriptional regulator [Spirochaetales bacterium]|nr:sigma-54-dependent Fis family transcriptional regulator [Spirochaetales bacterium]